MALSDLVIDIAGSAKGFRKTLSGVNSGLGGLVKTTAKVAGGMSLAFGGVLTALGPIALGLKAFQAATNLIFGSSDLARTQIAAEKKLGGVLKATGGAAGLTADEIKRLASERQNLTNFGDEATLNAAAILATFKEVKGDVFKKSIVLMQDMAAVMDTDLAGSAVQLGKAINDPILGVSALSEVGVNFTYKQKEMIRALVESGKLMQAQGVILSELESEFGGAAEAMANPLAQAGNAWSDFQEQLGMIFNEIKVAALDAFGFQELMAGTKHLADDFRKNFLPTIKSVFNQIGSAFGRIVNVMRSRWDEWSARLSGVFDRIRGSFSSVHANWESFSESILTSLEKIGNSLDRDFARALQAVVDNLPDLADGFVAAFQVIEKMVQGLVDANEWLDKLAFTSAAIVKGISAEEAGKIWRQMKDHKKDMKELDDIINSVDNALAKNDQVNQRIFQKYQPKPAFDFTPAAAPTPKPLAPLKPSDFKPLSSTEVGTQAAYEKIFGSCREPLKKSPPNRRPRTRKKSRMCWRNRGCCSRTSSGKSDSRKRWISSHEHFGHQRVVRGRRR